VNLTLVAALLVGLVGSVHCLGMCGGISAALSLGTGDRRRWLAPMLNSAGRVTTYMAGGAVVGALGWGLLELLAVPGWGRLLVWFTALMFVLMGASMLFRVPGLLLLERGGARLWRRLQPLAARSFRLRGPGGAYLAGLVWGWLPCGLVYSMLAAAAASGSPLRGALLMGCFGLGTSLAMAATGYAAGAGAGLEQRRWLRRPVGVVLVLVGLWTALAPGQLLPARGADAGQAAVSGAYCQRIQG
jgi:uncharacterized protein